LVLGSIDELAVREAGAGADECDEVGCVHRASVPVLTRWAWLPSPVLPHASPTRWA